MAKEKSKSSQKKILRSGGWLIGLSKRKLACETVIRLSFGTLDGGVTVALDLTRDDADRFGRWLHEEAEEPA